MILLNKMIIIDEMLQNKPHAFVNNLQYVIYEGRILLEYSDELHLKDKTGLLYILCVMDRPENRPKSTLHFITLNYVHFIFLL